jgi:hypothetical protein
MPNISFDGATKEIRLSEVGAYSAEAIYSGWKVWASIPANAGWYPAFDTIGGDPIGGEEEVAPYFFIRNDNDWTIKMPNEDGEIIITGNLFQRDPSQDMFTMADGFTAFLRLQVSSKSIVNTVESSTGGLTDIQDALISKISKKVNLLVAN